LEEARELVKSRIPEGLYLLSEQVISDGKPKTVKANVDTIEAAFAKAQSQIPTNATIIEKKELSAPGQQVIAVQAFDERGAESAAKRQLGKNMVFKGLNLTAAGRNGFLGIGRTPSKYEAEVFRQAVVEITWKSKAKIVVNVGTKSEVMFHNIQALKNELWSDRANAAEALGRIGDAAAVETLVELLNSGYADLITELRKQCYALFNPAASPYAFSSSRRELDGQTAFMMMGQASFYRWLVDEYCKAMTKVAGALGEIGDPRAVAPLFQGLLGTSDYVRSKADNFLARELGKDSAALKRALETLHPGFTPEMKEAFKQALIKIGKPTAKYIVALGDRDRFFSPDTFSSEAFARIDDRSEEEVRQLLGHLLSKF